MFTTAIPSSEVILASEPRTIKLVSAGNRSSTVLNGVFISRTFPYGHNDMEIRIAQITDGDFYVNSDFKPERADPATALVAIAAVSQVDAFSYYPVYTEFNGAGDLFRYYEFTLLRNFIADQSRDGFKSVRNEQRGSWYKARLGLAEESDLPDLFPSTPEQFQRMLDVYANGELGRHRFLMSLPSPDMTMRMAILAEDAGLLCSPGMAL